MTNIDQRANALRHYDSRGVPRKISEPVIDAFVGHGFVLHDVGGGDIVWTAEYFTSGESTGGADLTLGILADTESGLVEDLHNDVFNAQVQNGDDGGFYFTAVGPKLLLDSYGDFNVRRRGE